MAKRTVKADSVRDNVVQFVPRSRRLRADVPQFDPSNPAHLRAWEAMYDVGVQSLREGWGARYGK